MVWGGTILYVVAAVCGTGKRRALGVGVTNASHKDKIAETDGTIHKEGDPTLSNGIMG